MNDHTQNTDVTLENQSIIQPSIDLPNAEITADNQDAANLPIAKSKTKLLAILMMIIGLAFIGVVLALFTGPNTDSVYVASTNDEIIVEEIGADQDIEPVIAPGTATFQVSFVNGSKTIKQVTVAKDGKVNKISISGLKGFIFDNWYLNDVSYDFSRPVVGDITLVAKWKAAYTVMFNSNGGSNVKSVSVASGGSVARPADPTRSGYTFSEWQLNKATYNFGSAVKGNIVLVAVWKKNQTSANTGTPVTPPVVNPGQPNTGLTKEQILAKMDAVLIVWRDPIFELDLNEEALAKCSNPKDGSSNWCKSSGDLQYVYAAETGCGVYVDAKDQDFDGCGQVGFDTFNRQMYFTFYNQSANFKCNYDYKTNKIAVTNSGQYVEMCPEPAECKAEFTKLLKLAKVTSAQYLGW